MKTMRLLPLLLVALAPLLAGWTFLGDNILGHSYDYVTVRAPSNNDVLMYRSSDGKWIAGASSSALADASTSAKGVTKLDTAPASATNPIAVGVNSVLLNPTPGTVGTIIVSNGAGYGATLQGAANTLLHGTGATTPTFSQLVNADVAAGAAIVYSKLSLATSIVIGDLAAALSARIAPVPATAGEVVVGTGTGYTATLQGAANTLLHGVGAGTPTWSQLVNADVAAGAAIVYSKLSLATSIVIGDLAAALSARIPPVPATAGEVVVGTGTGYTATAQGAANTLLHGVGAGTPTWSKVVAGDVTAATLTATEMATSVTNRLNLAPSTVGNIPVDAGSATPYTFIDGSDADTTKALFATGAAASPAFRNLGATDIDELLASSDLTDFSAAKSGTGTSALSNTAPVVTDQVIVTGQSGNPGTFIAGSYSYDTTQKSFHDSIAAGVLQRGGVYSVQTADSSAITAASEVAFDTLPTAFPANSLTVKRVIRWRAKYLVTTSGAPTFTMKWKLGTTVIADSGGSWSTANGVTNGMYIVLGECTIRTIGGSGTYDSNVQLIQDNLGSVASSAPGFGGPTDRFGSPAANIDTTASQQLTDTWTWSTTSQTIKRTSLVVEVW